MNGLVELNTEVQQVLENKNNKGANFRIWRGRFKKDELSLELKIKIVELYGDKEVLVTIKNKSHETREILFHND